MSRRAPRTWLAVVLAGWLADGSPSSAQATGEADLANRPPAVHGVVHRVVIERFAFRPRELELRVGDQVEWINLDLAPHTASAGDGGWDSGELGREAIFRQRFTAPGRVDYFCAFHPMMRGAVTVVAP